MHYRVLALDLDGTVLDSHKNISPNTKEAILCAEKQGVRVVLASGRPLNGVLSTAEALQIGRFGGYILSFNGARLVDYKTGGVIYNRTIDAEWVFPVCRFAKENDMSLVTYLPDGVTAITEDPEDPYIQLEARINRLKMETVPFLPEAVRFPVNKFLLAGEPDHLAKMEPLMREQVKGKLNVFRSEPFFLEVLPLQVDKAAALAALLEQIGASKEELMACGDGFNDVTMIRYAGLGVAMENAQAPVKEAADFITRSNEADGVAFAVRKFILSAD